jgi:predicted dehydrogenase
VTEPDRREFLLHAAGAVAATWLVPDLAAPSPLEGMEPIEVGLVGAGRQGRAILGELAKFEAVRVTALCDVDPSRLESGLRRGSGLRGYSDHRAMLEAEKGLSAIFVATPTHLHREIAVHALEAGRHVYCESPLASTIEDSRAIAKAAAAASTVFQAGFQGRSNPIYRLAWTFFRSDSVRDLVSVRAQNCRKTSWTIPAENPARERVLNWRLDPEVSIGLEGELGAQQFDVLHWYLGAYPVSVSGSGSIRLHRDGRKMPDTVQCVLAFESGVRASYEASLANSFEGALEVFRGTNATVKLAWTFGWMFKEADAPTQGWEVYANRQRFHNDEGITLIADATKLASQGRLAEGVGLPNPPLYYSIERFLASASKGEPVVCSAEEGHRATAVGVLAHRAVTEERRVEIGEGDLAVG